MAKLLSDPSRRLVVAGGLAVVATPALKAFGGWDRALAEGETEAHGLSLFGDLAKSGTERAPIPLLEPTTPGPQPDSGGVAVVFAVDAIAADMLAGPPSPEVSDPSSELNADPTTSAKERSSEDLSESTPSAIPEPLKIELTPSGRLDDAGDGDGE